MALNDPRDVPPTLDPSSLATTRRRLQRLAWLYDSSIPLPGGFRVGLDSVIGLIPGIGDFIGLAMGGHVLYESMRVGVPRSVLVRMVGNVAIDSAVGAIPGLGDLFDFAFKSNVRNLRLLEAHLDEREGRLMAPAQGSTRNRAIAIALIALVVLGMGVVIWGVWSLVGALIGAVTGTG